MDVAQSAVPIITSQQQHDTEMSSAAAQHVVSLSQLRLHHSEATQQAENIHKQQLAYSTTLFQQAMHVDIDLALRDASREAVRQYSLVTSTTVVVNVLLINGAFLIATQWNLPWDSVKLHGEGSEGGTLLVVLACGVAASFLLSMLSIVVSLKLQRGLLDYDPSQSLKRYKPCRKMHANFNQYFECHGSQSLKIGTVATALSVSCLMLAAVCLLYPSYLWRDKESTDDGGAQTKTAPTVGLIVFAVCAGWVMLLFTVGNGLVTSSTHVGPADAVGMNMDRFVADRFAD